MAGPVNGQIANLGFRDRLALLFGRRPDPEGKNGDHQGKETAGVLPLEAPAPIASTSSDLNLEVAEVLSVSQVNTFLDCAARWYFKHFLGLPDVIDAKRALGNAVHKALEENFRQKIQSRKDLEREHVLELYATAWQNEAEQARFAEDDDKAELERTGAVLVQKYLVEAAPEITPIAVEQRVSGVIAGVKVRGYIDLLDSNGRIIDIKPSSKKPSGIRPDSARQIATYAQITPGASGKAAVHTLVRTKTPQLVEQNHQVTDADRRHVEIIYPLVQEGMRNGLYTPNRGSMFCSRTSCAYWQACEKEFGGTVEE